MGFCTVINPRTGREVLACDFCSAHPARKIRCPYNYCQAWATCADCRRAGKHRNSSCGNGTHKQICEPLHVEFVATIERDAAIVATGAPVRRAALNQGANVVRVLFRDKDNRETYYHMADETYHAIPYHIPTTPDDYAKHGAIERVAVTDLYETLS